MINKFKSVGIFGNSNVDNTRDWIDALIKDVDFI